MLDKLQQDLKEAMLSKDETRVSTLRMLISAIRYTGNGRDSEFSDDEVVSVIQKEVKKRKEAAESFKKGGREESAQKEEAELAILESYLPVQLSNEELTALVDQAITEVGANGVGDMGKVIGAVMAKAKGQADGGVVSSLVKERLIKG